MEKKIRTVFMSGTETGCYILKALRDCKHAEIVMAVTNPDRRSGRGRKTKRAPIAECAEEMQIELFQTADLNAPDAAARISSTCPDAAIVVDYGTILSGELLDIFTMGAYNLHYSILPDLRGAEPVRWALARGYDHTGITCIKMDEHIDTGLVFTTRSLEIMPDDDYGTLKSRLTVEAVKILGELTGLLSAGGGIPLVQQAMTEGAVYAKKIDKSMQEIDWSKSARDTVNLVRGMSPVPACHTLYGIRRKRLKIYKAMVGPASTGEPGTVQYADKNKLIINAGDESIIIMQVQPEGGRKMDVSEFLAGARVKIGEKL